MPSLNPYISFKDQAREAMEYYQSVFGGELVVSTFAEYPGMIDDPPSRTWSCTPSSRRPTDSC